MAEFVPGTLGIAERSLLLNALVAPRPVAFVSTVSPDGHGNLAPFSFFMAAGYSPMAVAFSATNWRDGATKDTLRNVEATGEFVVSVSTRAMAERLNQASYRYAYGEDEFDHAGFTRAPSVMVAPPRVAESPAALECRVLQIVKTGDGPGAGNVVVGEVVHVHVDPAVMEGGLPDNRKIEHLVRLGADYFSTQRPEALFALKRPETP
ncbi:MAG: flavin reductase family protein [Gemmatimonadaceae bacterium]|jgi:flavin reductase (DIM6/NTAB) family NADH-FMN oxidoreductase RutF|nr:flavin reductase family protein [Gemmatimonadaceae bacterium]